MDIYSANSMAANSDGFPNSTFAHLQPTLRFMTTSQIMEAREEAKAEGTTSYNGLLAAFAFLLCICLCLFAYKYIIRLRVFYEATARLRSPRIPCSRCRFFNPSPHLKCAVHPTKVLTPKAINCSDQWLRDHDEFSFKETHIDEP